MDIVTSDKKDNLLTNVDFSEEIIMEYINNISNSSSTGPDGLSGKMIKKGRQLSVEC